MCSLYPLYVGVYQASVAPLMWVMSDAENFVPGVHVLLSLALLRVQGVQ